MNKYSFLAGAGQKYGHCANRAAQVQSDFALQPYENGGAF